MKKYLFLVLLYSFIFETGYSQNDSISYNHSISINANDLLIKRLFVTYSRPLSKRNVLELACGYKYSDRKTIDAGSFFYIDDAFWYYNNITLRAGLKRYYDNNIFLGLSSNFNYQFFDKIRFKRFVDREGDSHDQDYVISRTKFQLGSLLKFGVTSRARRRVLIEKYIGVGLSYEIREETVYGRYFYSGDSPDLNPTKTSKNKFIPTFHFGISIGLAR